MAAPAVTITGNFDSLTGASTGFVKFALSGYGAQIPRVSGTGVLAPLAYTSAVGASFSVTLWGNDVISPANATFYLVSVYNADGSNVTYQTPYQFTGSGSFDLSTLTPIGIAPPPLPVPSFVGPNLIAAGPASGGSGPSTFRSMVAADLPSIPPSAITGIAVVENPSGAQTITGQALNHVSAPLVLDASSPLTLNGTTTANGAVTTNSTLTAQSLNGALYAAQFTGADLGAKVNAALAALPATGGTIVLPTGASAYSTTIAITKPTRLIGQDSGFNNRGTLLNYTGTGIGITVYASSDGTQLKDFSLTNSGTGTVGIDIDQGPYTIELDNLNMAANTKWSTAAIRIGNTTTGSASQNLVINRVSVYNETIALQALRVINLLVTGCQFVADTTGSALTQVVQIGSTTNAAYKVSSATFEGCTFGTPVNTDLVAIQRGLNILFSGCNFENDGTGYCVNIPATAVQASGIVISGSRFQASGINSCTRVAQAGIGAASLYLINCITDNQYAAGTHLVANSITAGQSGQVYIWGCTDTTGNVSASSSLVNTTVGAGFLGNTPAGATIPISVTTPNAILTAVAPTVSAGQVGLGSTTATTANIGASGAPPAQVLGYLIVNIAGTTVKIPYYAN